MPPEELTSTGDCARAYRSFLPPLPLLLRQHLTPGLPLRPLPQPAWLGSSLCVLFRVHVGCDSLQQPCALPDLVRLRNLVEKCAGVASGERLRPKLNDAGAHGHQSARLLAAPEHGAQKR